MPPVLAFQIPQKGGKREQRTSRERVCQNFLHLHHCCNGISLNENIDRFQIGIRINQFWILYMPLAIPRELHRSVHMYANMQMVQTVTENAKISVTFKFLDIVMRM